MSEPKAKKANPNYEASAVNLVNPPEVGAKLALLAQLKESLSKCEAVLEAYPEYAELTDLHKREVVLEAVIKELVEEQGSYQDIDAGSYAIKQRRETISYTPAMVFDSIGTDLAKMVLVQTVDVKKLEGLAKGGFITPEQVKASGTISTTYAYIIR